MAVEVTQQAFRQDLVNAGTVIETQNLWKTYEMGTEELHALRGVNLEISKGEYVAIMGPVGFGQIHLDEPDRVPGLAQQGQLLARRAGWSAS